MTVLLRMLRDHHVKQAEVCFFELAYKLRDEPQYAARLNMAHKQLRQNVALLDELIEEYGDEMK